MKNESFVAGGRTHFTSSIKEVPLGVVPISASHAQECICVFFVECVHVYAFLWNVYMCMHFCEMCTCVCILITCTNIVFIFLI